MVGVKNTPQDQITLRQGELAVLPRRERHHVLRPGALEVGQTSLRVLGPRGADCEGAVGSARGGHGPQQSTDLLLEQRQTPIQRLIKRLLFALDDLLDIVLLGADFGEDVAHRIRQHGYQLVKERLMEAQGAPIADCSTQDAPEDVIAIVVARLDAVGNREAQRAYVVSNHTESDVDLLLLSRRGSASRRQGGPVLLPAQLLDLIKDRTEDVSLIIRDDAGEVSKVPGVLHYARDALKAHARIYMLRRQG